MAGATSLVELILKKWGDDIAGAAKELEEKVGFPESVANRIATGELPMDEASRVARAAEQGYGDTLFRGHNSKKNPATSSDDMWMTDSPATAQTYADAINADYAPEAPDFEGWYSYYKEGDISDVTDVAELESLKNDYDGFLSKWNSSQPEPPGVVTPLRHNAEDLAAVRGDGKHFESVQTNSNKLKGLQANPETKGIHKGTDNIAEAVRDSGSYQGTLFKGVKDDFEVGKGTQKSDVYNILGSRPDVSIRHADAAFDPQYKGSNIMGGAAGTAGLAGLLAAGQSEDADAGFVTKGGKTLLEAWHGSPHKFDKFSMDQIGTGEGAQAYGHGLYFADSEDVAKGYRDNLSITQNGLDGSANFSDNPVDSIAWMLNAVDESRAREAIGVLDYRGNVDELIDAAKKRLEQSKSGALYRTEIDVTPESLLDWDKPLSEQSDHIKSEFAKYADERGMAQETRDQFRGEQIYERLGSSIDPERGRGLLLDKNIKGIKYLDGDSRAAGNGSSNYVIFDDSLINIAERGNADPRLLAGIAGTTAAGLAAPMIKDSGMISAPRSETLFDLTMGARDIERRLEGSLGSLLFPSGLVDYLETVNRREEDPNAMTRGMALLDVLPF